MIEAPQDRQAADDRFYVTDAALDNAERDASRDRSDCEGTYILCVTCGTFAWTPVEGAPYEGAECARCAGLAA